MIWITLSSVKADIVDLVRLAAEVPAARFTAGMGDAMMSDTLDCVTQGLLRRIPKQERSRERIDDILKVSMDLIGSKGIDAVTMKEIASLAGGPIASIYQYFPNKSAIVTTLYKGYVDGVETVIRDGVAKVETVDDLFVAIEYIFDHYHQSIRRTPALQDILNAVQADKELAVLDLKESRHHARIFSDATSRFVSPERREEFARMVFLMFHLAEAAVRLALLADEDEAVFVIRDFKSASAVQMRRFLAGAEPTA